MIAAAGVLRHIMELDLAKEKRELLVLNGLVRKFEGPLGLRSTKVNCLSRDGRVVEFADPEHITLHLDSCLSHFNSQISKANDLLKVSAAAAYFWMTFICIHPFLDGNGRTAQAYLEKILLKHRYQIKNFDLIDRYLITGDVQTDLKKITALFIVSLIPLGGTKYEQLSH